MPVISIENLKYRYPGTKHLAIDDISLTIEKGEFIGIVGQNGAGKSTLSQAMIGLVPQFYKGAYGGKVTVDGIRTDTCPVEEMCEKVGLIFQNPFNQLSGAAETVYGEVAFGLQNLGIPAQEMKERIEKALKQLDIWQYRNRNPFNLSGGQMQRVAIASILVMQPEIIILDEPTSQLDPEGTEEVFRVVDTLTSAGFTIIMIEQKLEKMAKYCDRLILMSKGKVIDFDTPEKIFSRDDLEKLGVQPPAYTRICRQYGLKKEDGTYPVTLEDTINIFKEKGVKLRRPESGKDAAELGHNVFRAENLDFSYNENVHIFENLNLLLDKRATAIIGQNGAGKTTLVRLLKGLLKPQGGRIWFGEDDISGKTVAMLADKVGYVFQNPDDQIFKYKVLDEVMYGPLNIGMSEETAREKSLKALELMGLKGKEKMNPYDLELNERKMTAIASVIAMDTDVVILDEPTIAQDYPGRQLIGNMIRELSEAGKLVIAILHDMDFVEENFDRVIVMAHGKLLCDGTSAQVFSEDDVLKEARLQKPYLTELFTKLEQ
ncbi:energy-coupling factor transport system ATP-binding protein [Lachnospiraceae bacterium]|nr:energy-coupling factor transport system ATP-binding protein [Lachnospiraceae bacterium]